jgi:hypothetical protein
MVHVDIFLIIAVSLFLLYSVRLLIVLPLRFYLLTGTSVEFKMLLNNSTRFMTCLLQRYFEHYVENESTQCRAYQLQLR